MLRLGAGEAAPTSKVDSPSRDSALRNVGLKSVALRQTLGTWPYVVQTKVDACGNPNGESPPRA